MRWYKRRSLQVAAAVGSLAIVLSACSSSKTTGNSSGGGGGGGGGGSTAGAGLQINNPNISGTPVKGGKLTVLGASDVDNNLDPNIGYYTVDYQAQLLYNRSLYTYPSIQGQTFTLAPDLATAAPKVTDNGLLVSVTIRKGAMWNSNPPRQVNAADVIRGLKRSCNPVQPFGGQPDYADLLPGYGTFCDGFQKVSATSATAQAAYINGHDISDVTVDQSDPLTVQFHLAKPAYYFEGVLNLTPFNPAPVEDLQYLPYSTDLAVHQLCDGPYIIKSYNPNTSIIFVRNPAWNASSDPIRKAYVDEIDISETGQQTSIAQQILTNTAAADMQWDIGPPPSMVPGLITSKNPDFQLVTEGATNPYIIFNTISKNNGGALGNVLVRQAIAYAIDRSQLIQNHNGPQVSPPLTHIIAPGTNGNTPDFDPYPFNVTKAKSLLQQAGIKSLTLTLLYRNQSATQTKDFQTLQAQLAPLGITIKGLPVSQSDFYGKYLVPGTAAKNSVWDLAEAGWGPDWYPTGGKSYFVPILASASVPPNGSNYGFFADPKLDSEIQAALAAPDDASASKLWHEADVEAMAQAAVYPIEAPNEPSLHGSQVHNCIFIGPIQNCALANVWLSR